MIKRVFDVVVAVAALAVLSPLLLVIAVLQRAFIGPPILFRQRRPGRDGVPFELIKFRTMRNAVGRDGAPLPDAERLTRFGAFLRSSSIDELPELWNVIRGDMSLVGPRPLLMDYLPLYNTQQARRHEVRPGMTGWAQISGRNSISWDDKFALDVWYVDHQGFWLDLRILFMTIARVLSREGITQEGEATVQPFRGSAGSAKA